MLHHQFPWELFPRTLLTMQRREGVHQRLVELRNTEPPFDDIYLHADMGKNITMRNTESIANLLQCLKEKHDSIHVQKPIMLI